MDNENITLKKINEIKESLLKGDACSVSVGQTFNYEEIMNLLAEQQMRIEALEEAIIEIGGLL